MQRKRKPLKRITKIVTPLQNTNIFDILFQDEVFPKLQYQNKRFMKLGIKWFELTSYHRFDNLKYMKKL